MGLPRRHERFLDPDMQLLFPEAEPDPTASPELLRLLELDQPEQLAEEPPRLSLTPRRSRHLDMIQLADAHLANLARHEP
jgi:hypothetical protein